MGEQYRFEGEHDYLSRISPVSPLKYDEYTAYGGFALDREHNSPPSPNSIAPLPIPSSYYSNIYGTYSDNISTSGSIRPTPTSLGWSRPSELVKLYNFVVPKGKEPYLQLKDNWTPTYETPTKVFLDEER